MAGSKKGVWKELLCVSGICVAVFLISIAHLREISGVKVYADEVGYWRNAALLAGRDWSYEASSSVYYGFGYGFLLMPILKFWNTAPEIMMRMAIVMQGLMLSSCIAAAWLILKKLRVTAGLGAKAIIVLFSVLNTANIFVIKFMVNLDYLFRSSYMSV